MKTANPLRALPSPSKIPENNSAPISDKSQNFSPNLYEIFDRGRSGFRRTCALDFESVFRAERRAFHSRSFDRHAFCWEVFHLRYWRWRFDLRRRLDLA